jgi:two-component system sensor histidine kinase UhpB
VLEPNKWYRRLIEGFPDGIVAIRDTTIAFANAAAAVLFGAPDPGALHGRSILDFIAGNSLVRLRNGSAQLHVQQSGGGTVQVHASPAHIDDPDGPLLVLAMRDVTGQTRAEAALRESEERLRLAFAGAQEGVWDWNLETDAVVYSPRWKQMLGYEEDEIEPNVGEWERLLHPDDMPAARQLNDSVQRGAPTYEGEFRLRHKDGHYIHVLSRGFPIRREPGGPVVRIVGTHFDLTERHRREAERARSELLARLVFAQEDERRRIAREMHDQFGEQLTSLSREIALLKEACAGQPDLSGYVQALEAISQQLDGDVDHLVWQLRPTALDDLGLRAALANYVQDWSKRVKIRAELHMSGLMDERLPPDAETTLYRIAQEALTNVARHSRATSVDVMLERQSDCVLLIVEDNGVGFEPDETESARGGFGLLGMNERAALVGATVQIESSQGKGTTILLRLPTPTDHA